MEPWRAGPRPDELPSPKVLRISTAIVVAVATISVLTGIWFVADDVPFNGPGDYSSKFGVKRADLDQRANPSVGNWAVHIVDQAGFLSISYGLFMVTLAWFGMRRGMAWSWVGLLIGGTPALIGGTIEPRVNLETGDSGAWDYIILALFAAYLVALALPARPFVKQLMGQGKNA